MAPLPSLGFTVCFRSDRIVNVLLAIVSVRKCLPDLTRMVSVSFPRQFSALAHLSGTEMIPLCTVNLVVPRASRPALLVVKVTSLPVPKPSP